MLTKESLIDVLNYLNNINLRLSLSNQTPNELEKIKFCIDILAKFSRNYNNWAKNCPLSMNTVSKYISEKYLDNNGVEDIFYVSCAKFLREYILFLRRNGLDNDWLSGNWSSFVNNAHDLIKAENRKWLDYLINGQFDIDVINNFLGGENVRAFLRFEENLSKINQIESNIESKKTELENLLEKKEEKVNILAKKLEEQKTAFNFVGLSKGFENLLSEKESAKNKSFRLMIGICIALILFPLIFICARFLNWFNIQWNQISWEDMLPVLGLEFVLIYFFRVVLNHYNSIQTQIMQIELRQALCQFIQSYIDYAKEIKDKEKEHGGNSLEKFENLIFSNILSSPDKVPSTFDGVEQLANMINSLKGKS